MLQRLRFPFFVFLLAPFFVLNGFNDHPGFIPPPDALMLLGVYLLATIALFAGSYFLFRSRARAAIFSFVLLAVHLFFGPVHDTLKNWFDNSLITQYKFLLPLVVICIVALFVYLFKTKKFFQKLTTYLNVVLIVFLAIEAVELFYRASVNKSDTIQIGSEFSICDNCEKPDVYVIISDEYAGKTSLREVFNFDNEPFVKRLEERGFRVISKSNSNYNFTPYSIASTLNMDYLGKENARQQELLNHTYETTKKNALLKFMSAHGYDFYNYSLLDYPNHPSPAASSFLPVKTRLITSQTLLSRLNRDLRFNLVTKLKSEKEQKRVVYTPLKNNQELVRLTKEVSSVNTSKPKFVLTHLMMPHYPYYFNKEGKPYPYDQLIEGNQSNKSNYLEYLQYCNGELLSLIDHIKKNTSKEPVIVLLSDHGFRHLENDVNPEHFFDNLVAFNVPGADYAAYPDTISNVNLFRIILNHTFKQKLPYLRDSTFIMENP